MQLAMHSAKAAASWARHVGYKGFVGVMVVQKVTQEVFSAVHPSAQVGFIGCALIPLVHAMMAIVASIGRNVFVMVIFLCVGFETNNLHFSKRKMSRLW